LSTRTDELVYELDEAERRRAPVKDLTRKPSVAELMLATNAGGSLDATIKSNTTFAPNSHPIERIGSVLIDTIYFLLNHYKCPPAARDVVLVICGLSGGDYQNYTKVTQKQIGERMGIQPEAVREKLKLLIDWEQEHNRAVLQIRQQEREGEARHFGITEYRPIILRYAGQYMRMCAERGLPPIRRQQELTPKTEQVYDEVADCIYEEMEESAFIPRNQKTKNVTPPQQQLTFIERTEDEALRRIGAWADALVRSQYDVADYAPEFVSKVYDLLSEKSNGVLKSKRAIEEINRKIAEKAERGEP
jgi:hypothetical protein